MHRHLLGRGFEVYGTVRDPSDDPRYSVCNILDYSQVLDTLTRIKPEGIVHLAGISFVGHEPALDFYQINVIGAEHVLKASRTIKSRPEKIILASSSVVYGNQPVPKYHEALIPDPVNHYGISKYAMEQMAKTYMADLPILLARPFNYTGVGQSGQFLVPKIVKHFAEAKAGIELGNLDVRRELNDVAFICEAYSRLLITAHSSEVVNISSGRSVHLQDIIGFMNEIAGYSIRVSVNPQLVRKNEIPVLTGDGTKLQRLVGNIEQVSLRETLANMYEAVK